MKKLLNIIFYIVPFFSLIVIFNPEVYIYFWKTAFYLLIMIMFSRPLKDIFPKKLSRLRYIIWKRKELWIIIWVFAITHFIGYLLNSWSSISLILNPDIWNFGSYLAWWFLALIISIPLLFTSNKFSMIKLWRNWKRLQYLAYLMFIFVIIHVILIKQEDVVLYMILLCSYVFVLFFSSYIKKKRSKKI